ncbi:hypothetical protein EC3234A_198c00010 [Escherichia coli]|nr:hypothetical protein EC3234A_198c00010 [Escherichia coli]
MTGVPGQGGFHPGGQDIQWQCRLLRGRCDICRTLLPQNVIRVGRQRLCFGSRHRLRLQSGPRLIQHFNLFRIFQLQFQVVGGNERDGALFEFVAAGQFNFTFKLAVALCRQ